MALSDLAAFRRRAILIGTGALRAEMELSQAGRRFMANESFTFVDINAATEQQDRILRRLSQRGLLEIGSLLVQSPTNQDRYERLPATPRIVAQERINVMVNVCQELGARQITIAHAESDLVADSVARTASASGGPPLSPVELYSVKAARSRQDINFNGLMIQTSWTFEGKPADADAAARALEESQVYAEELEQMIKLFRSQNRPISHSFEVSTASDMQRVADLMAEVGLPFAKVQAELESFRQTRTVLRSRVTAEFGAR